MNEEVAISKVVEQEKKVRVEDIDLAGYKVLKAINDHGKPVGANTLSLNLGIPLATVGRILQKLEFKGLLSQVSNKGRTLTRDGLSLLQNFEISQYSTKNVIELKELISNTNKSALIEILQVRRLLEVDAVGQASKIMSTKQIDNLRYILALEEERKKDGSIASKENIDFHIEISIIAGNHLVTQLLQLLMYRDGMHLHTSIVKRLSGIDNNVNHYQILDAMEKHNVELAKNLMEQHISFVINYIENYY